MNTNNRSIIRNTFYIQLLAFIPLSLSSSVGSMIDGVVIDEDPTYHIGLRMIANLAREIQYTCVLKLNNILVKI